jgi:predicted aconitase
LSYPGPSRGLRSAIAAAVAAAGATPLNRIRGHTSNATRGSYEDG